MIVVGIALVVVGGFLFRIATVYTITNQRLRIKRGLLVKRVQQTRIDRVQNVNTDQSVLERMLRVGTVDFDTAGHRRLGVRFPRGQRPGQGRGGGRPRPARRGGRRPARRRSSRSAARADARLLTISATIVTR